MIGCVLALAVKTYVENKNFVPTVYTPVIIDFREVQQPHKRYSGNQPVVVHASTVGQCYSLCLRIDSDNFASRFYFSDRNLACYLVDIHDCSTAWIYETAVVRCIRWTPEITHYLLLFRIREKTPHSVTVQSVEVGGI